MGDFAMAFSNGATAIAYRGVGDFALADGTNAAPFAGGFSGNEFDTAIDIGNNNGPDELALAGVSSNDFSFVDAANSSATGGGDILDSNITGSNDIALALDPFGVGNDAANVGVNGFDAGNFDLGAILFDDNIVNEGASGADYLYDIVTMFATESNAAAAVSADWWSDLLALF